MSSSLKVAFYVRNAFQVQHLRPLFRITADAVWIVPSRKLAHEWGVFADRFACKRIFVRRKLESFDIVVSHAAPPGKKPLKRAKFLMVQYGYAKEPYNFGAWRKLADGVLAYGPYAQARFAEHTLAYAIGNPRLDDWRRAGFASEAYARLPIIENDKPVLLYAPTWGDLGSLNQWAIAIADLAVEYNVLIKAHHNSVRDGDLDFVKSHPDLHEINDADLLDAIAISDVLISDYSGAIFDGIMCKVPVVLLDVAGIEMAFGKKLDGQSIEMLRRTELGYRAADITELGIAVKSALSNGEKVSENLRNELFSNPQSVGQAFLEVLKQVMRV